MNRKEKGNLGEAATLLKLTQEGYEIFSPVFDNSEIDFLALKDDKIFKVTVKSTSQLMESGRV